MAGESKAVWLAWLGAAHRPMRGSCAWIVPPRWREPTRHPSEAVASGAGHLACSGEVYAFSAKSVKHVGLWLHFCWATPSAAIHPENCRVVLFAT